jgi:hypothetical protein
MIASRAENAVDEAASALARLGIPREAWCDVEGFLETNDPRYQG